MLEFEPVSLTGAGIGIGTDLPIPRPAAARVVVPPPQDGPGFWAGAPSAVRVDGVTYLAYRLRRPVGQGRGYAVVVAAAADGETFEPVTVVASAEFDTDSLERPTLTVTPEGVWRLYLSCATPGTKHWRVELIEAARPDRLRAADARVVLPGDAEFGVKDPVILRQDGAWHMWACLHPLASAEDADRMETRHAVSDDGVDWRWTATALAGRPGHWDARGVRFSSVLFRRGHVLAFYDGRAGKDENYEERTGIAVSRDGVVFRAVGDAPVAASSYAAGGLRYLTVLAQPDGGYRLYYEHTRADGAHELLTEFVGGSRSPVGSVSSVA